jgi:Flp pilus assembly protein TadB
MKKNTCKALLWIGIVSMLFGLIICPLLVLTSNSEFLVNISLLSIGIFHLLGFVLIIIAWINWNSERKEKERQETRQMQLKALEKGNINVNLKGKMRKLK